MHDLASLANSESLGLIRLSSEDEARALVTLNISNSLSQRTFNPKLLPGSSFHYVWGVCPRDLALVRVSRPLVT